MIVYSGNGTYSMKSQALDTSVGFVYDPTDYLLAAQYDKEVSRSICVCCTVCVLLSA